MGNSGIEAGHLTGPCSLAQPSLFTPSYAPMRLRDMLRLLEEAKYLEPDFEQVHGTSPPTFRLTNRDKLIQCLEWIEKVPPLYESAVSAQADVVPLHFLNQNPVTKSLRAVRYEAENLAKSIAAILPAEDPLSLAVQIPEAGSLEDLEKLVKRVRLVFERPVAHFYAGTVQPPKLQGFDVGSQWLVLAEMAQPVLNFILSIVNAGASFRLKQAQIEKAWAEVEEAHSKARVSKIKERQAEAEVRKAEAEARKAEAEVRKAELDGDMMAENLRALKEGRIREGLDELASGVTEAFAPQRKDGSSAHETDAIVRTGIQTWAELIEEGAALRTALNAPRDVAALCPPADLDPAKLEQQRIKLLSAARKDPVAEPAEET